MHAVSLPLISYRTAVTDAALLLAVYFVPALSHLLPFPLYLFEPMRLLLFAGLLIARNNVNTYFLALTIPLVSTIISGHPPFVKAVIMSFELYTNVVLLVWLSQYLRWPNGLAFFVSTVLSKVFYYGLKFAFLEFGLIQGSLISTPLTNQLITVLLLTVIYMIVLWLITVRKGLVSTVGEVGQKLEVKN